MNYRKFWEDYYGIDIPVGCEIHHIDGNRNNNNIENLTCVTIEEHLEIHKNQQNWGAVQAILARMNDKSGIKEAASKFQKEKIDKGTHNFQKMSPERRSEISKKTIENRLASGKGAFIIENITENSRRAGKIAAEKHAGFLNIDSPHHGSKHVKKTYWWVNEKGERKRSLISPGENWKKGMNYEM